jgi:hypothetical protein
MSSPLPVAPAAGAVGVGRVEGHMRRTIASALGDAALYRRIRRGHPDRAALAGRLGQNMPVNAIDVPLLIGPNGRPRPECDGDSQREPTS